ncbi:anhydro-N-acetylmuramic acid kinase [Flavihumibacter stibioxidans]|uniref:Anhydro-N-acetylmuramic acid kinase n=1 Tax=Flavihumibacter stibioxidans TaxID=1834163 RepID=A0ABR7M6A8_9BACT|nr:anhydro-N-acetylmuramic acid kinase [Flavihumibacter stibioxidans]MBC6490563.1 anhydro-N-acetylmuramic acid kinase [Flavihumibacter stibioxidans]
MVYKAIGLMSGSSLDGLDIAYVHFLETGGKWSMEIKQADCYPYSEEWEARLRDAVNLPALDYMLLHADYGHYIGQEVNRFISEYQLEHKVDMIASHGHTTFHMPLRSMTGQLGDGAAIAAETGLPVISDLRALDVAFGGQGAPIVPIGEKLLLGDYGFLLNIGGIANLSFRNNGQYYAYDVCPANRVLNMLAAKEKLAFDEGGKLASSGKLYEPLLADLGRLDYYSMDYPKSLANDFGTDLVYPMVNELNLPTADALRTFTEHIAMQLASDIERISAREGISPAGQKLLVTGGGALNDFLVGRIRELLQPLGLEVEVPDRQLVEYKEAVIMALIGVLRWREEYNVLSSVTGARRDSIGGAMWLGTEA